MDWLKVGSKLSSTGGNSAVILGGFIFLPEFKSISARVRAETPYFVIGEVCLPALNQTATARARGQTQCPEECAVPALA